MSNGPVGEPNHIYAEGLLARASLLFLAWTPMLIVGGIAVLLTKDMMRPNADDAMWPILGGVWVLFFGLVALCRWLCRARVVSVYSNGLSIALRSKVRFIAFEEMEELHNSISDLIVNGRNRGKLIRCEAVLRGGEKVSLLRHHAGVFDKALLAFMEALRETHDGWKAS